MIRCVENLSLFALIYLTPYDSRIVEGWESFIIRLDILIRKRTNRENPVENLSLFALIYLTDRETSYTTSWESFIIRLDILTIPWILRLSRLRIFHYSPWYTYSPCTPASVTVENLSLFALIYLKVSSGTADQCWESFIIRLDILRAAKREVRGMLRIFHYSPWYT